jgi:hypothetical protein
MGRLKLVSLVHPVTAAAVPDFRRRAGRSASARVLAEGQFGTVR